MINKDIKKILNIRYLAQKVIRSYFDQNNFIEIDGLIVVKTNCVESSINPIELKIGKSSVDGNQRYLITSPEIGLKKLLSIGLETIFQFSHVFRNDEESRYHLSEFSL